MPSGQIRKTCATSVIVTAITLCTFTTVWTSWPNMTMAETGTANSAPFSLDTMAQPAATHLTGKVIDAHSELPIRDAVVSLNGASPSRTATTNLSGEFSFPNVDYDPGTLTLTVNHPSGGYRPLTCSTTLIEGGSRTLTLELVSCTVILIHGIRSSAAVWEESLDGNSIYNFKTYLEANGYLVESLHFPDSCAGIDVNAEWLDIQIRYIRLAGIRSYSIVAHSAGGLITRQYLAAYPGESGNNALQIDKLIMLATPNHGSKLAAAAKKLRKLAFGCVDGAVIDNLIPGSDVLNGLNYGTSSDEDERDACSHHKPERLYGLPASDVFLIAGTRAVEWPCSELSPYVCGVFSRTSNDGIVAWPSASMYQYEESQLVLFENFWFDRELNASAQHCGGNFAITRSLKVAEAVKNILAGNPPAHSAIKLEPGGGEEPIPVQLHPELAGAASSSAAFVDSLRLEGGSIANFLAVWDADSLAFSLRAPSGAVISSAYADTSNLVDYAAGPEGARYTVTNPESGWWRVVITSADTGPDSVWVLTAFDSPLTLSAKVTPAVGVFSDVQCRALLLDGGLPLPNASVVASVADPDGGITTLQLFDNGTHGDQSPQDGEFSNSFMTSEMTGTYYVTFAATRDTTELQPERRIAAGATSVSNVAEIAVDPLGLVLSPTRLSLGTLVSMTSTFRNIGHAAAPSVHISLRNISAGTVLADTTVSLAVDQAFVFQTSWLAVVPDTSRFRIAATLGGGYESDYSNNSAQALAFVYLIDGVSNVGGMDDYIDGDPIGDQEVLGEEHWLSVGPNPFNPSIEIFFLAPEDRCRVSIDIFDMSGRRVRRLVRDVFDRGRHSVRWDGDDGSGRNVASGVYFCRLDAGGVTSVRKMMTVK